MKVQHIYIKVYKPRQLSDTITNKNQKIDRQDNRSIKTNN